MTTLFHLKSALLYRVVLPTVYFAFILIPTRRFRGFIVYNIYYNDHCKVNMVASENISYELCLRLFSV